VSLIILSDVHATGRQNYTIISAIIVQYSISLSIRYAVHAITVLEAAILVQ